jgi:hypothetical protein
MAYSKHDKSSPAISLRSINELENIAINKNVDSNPKEKNYVAIRTRSKTSFR